MGTSCKDEHVGSMSMRTCRIKRQRRRPHVEHSPGRSFGACVKYKEAIRFYRTDWSSSCHQFSEAGVKRMVLPQRDIENSPEELFTTVDTKLSVCNCINLEKQTNCEGNQNCASVTSQTTELESGENASWKIGAGMEKEVTRSRNVPANARGML